MDYVWTMEDLSMHPPSLQPFEYSHTMTYRGTANTLSYGRCSYMGAGRCMLSLLAWQWTEPPINII